MGSEVAPSTLYFFSHEKAQKAQKEKFVFCAFCAFSWPQQADKLSKELEERMARLY